MAEHLDPRLPLLLALYNIKSRALQREEAKSPAIKNSKFISASGNRLKTAEKAKLYSPLVLR